ncbi:class I SAM-dependent methyltransferase [Actinomadura sp. 6N118]|uniref:class I SAM-dependent methyltransferase n=1 Tax=Actinomadura sp. 6N118 TaxID=3375151 RepID=UPI0037ADD118
MAAPRRTRHREQAAPATPTARPPQPAADPSEPFDPWAATYDTSLLQQALYQPVHQAVLQHAHRHAPDPGRILDVGCGTGRLLHAAAHTYPHAALIGTDPSTQMIRCAAARPPGRTTAVTARIGFVRARAEALPFPDATFDLIVSTLSLRHWHNRRQGLTEIGRITTTRTGIIVIADVLQPPPGHSAQQRPHPRRWLPPAPHRGGQVLLPADLDRSLTAAGLRPEHIEPIHLAIPMTTTTLIVARLHR